MTYLCIQLYRFIFVAQSCNGAMVKNDMEIWIWKNGYIIGLFYYFNMAQC